MPLVNFTNLDFDQIKTSIKDYIRSNSNFTDYDFEGSNLSVIIDTLAYNTYIASYNANMVSNEVFIDSATLRENVVSLAKNVGYLPKSRTSARATISFFVQLGESEIGPTFITLKKGVVCGSLFATASNDSYIFSILDDITSPVVDGVAFFNDIEVIEGTFMVSNFLVNAFDPTQKYIIPNANVDVSTIKVSVRDSADTTTKRPFVFSDSIVDLKPTSRIYFLQEIEDERYELLFGDGIFGKKLETGNVIEVSYLISSGAGANRIDSFGFLGRLVDDTGAVISGDISLITTNSISDNGQEKETISSIKKYAPRVYASQNRAVTPSDYESIVSKIYPEAESVAVYGGEELDPPQYGKVFIAIKPKYGATFISNTVKTNIINDLRKYSVAGILPQIIDLKYLFIETESDIYYNRNLTSNVDDIATTVRRNISTYAKSKELNQYGSRFKYSKYQKLIDDSDEAITSNITRVKMRRDLFVSLNQPATYEICFGNPFFVKDCDGYNIQSSGFKIDDFADTVYISDLPDSNKATTGSIFLFKLISDTDALILRSNVGTIDYETGEIILFALNVSSTEKTSGGNSVIQIAAVPKSNDILGLQDLYLQLDINNISINMVSDSVSSGESTAGSYYTISSSYKQNNLVRK